MFHVITTISLSFCSVLIPEIEYELDGPEGLLAYIEKRIREQGHIVIVVAEGSGFGAASDESAAQQKASGERLPDDVGVWLAEKVKKHFSKIPDLQPFSMK